MIGSLSEMLNAKITDYTEHGHCIGCGACCSDLLPVSVDEVKRIRRYIKQRGIKERRHFVPTVKPVADMTCPFLDESKGREKCLIYPVRPAICREYTCHRHVTNDFRRVSGRCMSVSMRATFYGGGQWCK